jgi:NSS family neurotransmitter:Na+ symporter
MVYSLGHAFGIINWLSDPGPIMEMIIGSAKNALDLGAGISIYLIIAVVFFWIANWLIVKKGISGGIERIASVFTPLLIIIMIIFMINGIRLPGSAIGLEALNLISLRYWSPVYGFRLMRKFFSLPPLL